MTKESKWSLPDELKQAREAAAGAKASPNPAAGSVQVRAPFQISCINSLLRIFDAPCLLLHGGGTGQLPRIPAAKYNEATEHALMVFKCVQVVKLDAGSSPASVPNGASQASPLPTSSSTVKEDADGKPAAAATAATDAKFMYSSKVRPSVWLATEFHHR